MSSICENGCCLELDYGDRVRLVLKPEIKAQIIGEMNWGEALKVRLAPNMVEAWFQACEIELDPDVPDNGGNAAKPPADAPANDNVVRVDFRSVPAVGGIH